MIRITKQRLIFWLAFVGIVLVAFAIRLYKLGQVPVGLYWDEIAMYVDVKSVLQSGQDMFGRPWYQVIYPSYGDFKLPVYIWSAIASAKVFGLSEWSFRFPSVLAGIGTIVVSGFLARLMFAELFPVLEKSTQNQEKTNQAAHSPHPFSFSALDILQLITMVLITFTPWSIMFSRTGFEGHLAQFLLALSTLCVFLSVKRPKLIFLAPVFGALATYTYFSVRFVWIVVFVVAMVVAHFNSFTQITKNLKVALKKVVFFGIAPLLLYSLLFLPMLRSSLYGDANRFRFGTDSVLNKDYVVQSNIYRQFAGNSRWDRVMFNSKWLMIQELLKNYSANMSPDFMFVTGDPNLRHGTTQHGLFLITALPFFIWGFIRLFNKNKMIWLLLVVWWLVALLPASVPEDVPHALRSLNALVPLSLMIAFGVTDAILSWLQQLKTLHSIKWKKILEWGSWAGLAVIFAFPALHFIYFYFTIYPQLSAPAWQDGYKQLARAIYTQRTPGENIIIVSFDDRFYLWLMGYGPYTAQNFHSWQSEKYQFPKFGQEPITFENIDDKTILNQHKPTLVAGRLTAVTQQLAQMKIKPASMQEVDGVSPTEKFIIVKFSQ